MDNPISKRRFEMIDPIMDARTISTRPALMANNAIISSIIFPNVALTKPPAVGVVRREILSVAFPIKCARGSIDKIARTKRVLSPPPIREENREIGIKIRKQNRIRSIFSLFPPMKRGTGYSLKR